MLNNQRSPDEVVHALLEILKILQQQKSPAAVQLAQQKSGLGQIEKVSKRLHCKQGILVIETGRLSGFDVNAFISEIREEQIPRFDRVGIVQSESIWQTLTFGFRYIKSRPSLLATVIVLSLFAFAHQLGSRENFA